MKPANHFRVELPEMMSELPVKFPRVEKVGWTLSQRNLGAVGTSSRLRKA